MGLGVTYAARDTLTLRAGVAYDKSPVKDKFRTVRVPDSDRVWLAVGAGYRLSESLSVDIGYAHLFVSDAPINIGSATEGFVRGEFNNRVDINRVDILRGPIDLEFSMREWGIRGRVDEWMSGSDSVVE